MVEKDFFERLRENPRPVVVDFWAPWCGPCKMIDPILKKLSKQYEGQADLWKVNADEQPELLRRLKIYGIPTLVGFKNGQEIARYTGAAAPDLLERIFVAAISGEKPVASGPSFQERVWRITIGGVLLIFGYSGRFQEWYLLLAILGLLVILSAVYDRYPFLNKLVSRFKPGPK